VEFLSVKPGGTYSDHWLLNSLHLFNIIVLCSTTGCAGEWGPRKNKVTRYWKIVWCSNHALQPLPNSIRVIELRNVGYARHVACMGENKSIWGLYLFHTIALVNIYTIITHTCFGYWYLPSSGRNLKGYCMKTCRTGKTWERNIKIYVEKQYLRVWSDWNWIRTKTNVRLLLTRRWSSSGSHMSWDPINVYWLGTVDYGISILGVWEVRSAIYSEVISMYTTCITAKSKPDCSTLRAPCSDCSWHAPLTEQLGLSSNTSSLYSGRNGFESRLEYHLAWWTFHTVSLSSFQYISESISNSFPSCRTV